jgi:phage terminase Nu1 subunit (DNA packaging protein)
MGTLHQLPFRPRATMSKRELADYLGYTTRWIEMRHHDGLPFSKKRNGYCVYDRAEVEAWLREKEKVA